ncbi:hypothetical protein [Dyella japonica]|uniref:Tetratricopeptide (TPR) repeat protein n=1 Tax=Dyella japonica TaxID=231455 RepID=A0ABV2K127_9GAMM
MSARFQSFVHHRVPVMFALAVWGALALARGAYADVVADNTPVSCAAAAKISHVTSTACLDLAGRLVDQAHQYYLAGDTQSAQPYLEQAFRVAPGDLRVTFEQALVDDASGRPQQARQRYDALHGTAMENAMAVPSAVNFAVLGRFDDARKAFAGLSGSADAYVAGYAQLWQLWLDARTFSSEDTAALRNRLAKAVTGLRPANAQQQALLRLYAGQGDVDTVFAAIEASTPAGSLQRRDSRTEAAFFAGGYLQYVQRDASAAARLYSRELPQSGASVERPLIQQSIAAP